MATFVLVHGAGTGGWLWDDVAERLRAHGHSVPVEAVGGIGALEAGVRLEHVEELLQRRGSHPLATYREVVPASVAAPADVPRRFISCTDKPEGDPLLALAARLRGDGWRVQEMATGHFAMLTMPAGLASCLLAP